MAIVAWICCDSHTPCFESLTIHTQECAYTAVAFRMAAMQYGFSVLLELMDLK